CNCLLSSRTGVWKNLTRSTISFLNMQRDLRNFCDHINRCDVAIEQRNHAHQKGNPYHVRIDVTVRPRHELVAREEQMDNGSHAPLAKAIHDAFKTMERELRRVVDKQRRDVKTHADTRSPK